MARDGGRKRSAKAGKSLAVFKMEGGFTLAELLVFLLIAALFLTGVAIMIENGLKSSAVSNDLVRLDEEGNEAVSTMMRQLRVAVSLDPDSTANVITFTGDVDGDGNNDTVRFEVSDGYVKRGSGEGQMTEWIANAEQLNFSYYYYDDVQKQEIELTPGTAEWTNNYTSIRRIDMELRLSKVSVGSLVTARNFLGSVTLRNHLQ